MRIYRNLNEIAEGNANSAVTFGVFDGVHIGHAEIISTCVAEARARNLRAALITFDRHPREVVHTAMPDLLMTVDRRLNLISRMGMDECLVLDFNEELASTGADEFLDHFVFGVFSASTVVIGANQFFGRQRAGNAELVAARGESRGCAAVIVDYVELNGSPVSSTAIRERVRAGEVEVAARMLGRPFAVEGSVALVAAGSHADITAYHRAKPADGNFKAAVNGPERRFECIADTAVLNEGIRISLPSGVKPPAKGDDVLVEFLSGLTDSP